MFYRRRMKSSPGTRHNELPRSSWLKITLLIFIACAPAARSPAQQLSQSAAPEFEVASVKLSNSHELNGAYTYPGGRVVLRGCTLEYLIQLGFDMQAYQLSGGPAWIKSERYDIEARPPASSESSRSIPPHAKAAPNEEQSRMLESLLVKRFRLKYRHEFRQGPIYLLIRGKKNLLLKDAKDKSAYPWSGSPGGGMVVGNGIAGINETMEDLAWRLSRYLERPVIDQTGLSGSFDFEVEYQSDEAHPDVIASILTSIRDLGLKLQPSKGPVSTIVIEHAEKPSAN